MTAGSLPREPHLPREPPLPREPHLSREPRLGIDIGKVIINGPAHPGGGDTAFFTGDEATMLATPEMDGAVAAITRLMGRFDGRVWLVSKCGPRVQARTLRWLAAHRFSERTGLPPEHIRFCRERPDKRIHCEQLGLTHFVDDHPEVHAAIRGVVGYQYFFGPQRHPVPDYGIPAASWPETETLIEASLPALQPSPRLPHSPQHLELDPLRVQSLAAMTPEDCTRNGSSN